MNLYETLGVPRDATPGDIRLAFRREASKAHPDRGGDAARMQDVNKAYEVLGDHERRKQYDETGAMQEGPTLRHEAEQQIAMALQAVIAEGSDRLIEDVKRAISKAQTDMREHLMKLKDHERRLKKLSGRYKAKGEVNIVQGVIDQQLAGIPESRKELDHALKVLDEAVVVIGEYSGDADIFNSAMLFGSWSRGTGTTA